MTITPKPQRAKPVPGRLGPEGLNRCEIAGDGMIVHVAADHAAEPSPKDPTLSWKRRRSCALTAESLARKRFVVVWRLTVRRFPLGSCHRCG